MSSTLDCPPRPFGIFHWSRTQHCFWIGSGGHSMATWHLCSVSCTDCPVHQCEVAELMSFRSLQLESISFQAVSVRSSFENLCTSDPGILNGFKDLSVLPSFKLGWDLLCNVLFAIIAKPSPWVFFHSYFSFFLSIIIHIEFLLLHCEPARAVWSWAVPKLNLI